MIAALLGVDSLALECQDTSAVAFLAGRKEANVAIRRHSATTLGLSFSQPRWIGARYLMFEARRPSWRTMWVDSTQAWPLGDMFEIRVIPKWRGVEHRFDFRSRTPGSLWQFYPAFPGAEIYLLTNEEKQSMPSSFWVARVLTTWRARAKISCGIGGYWIKPFCAR